MSFPNLDLLNKDYVHFIPQNTQFSIVETQPQGEGRCHFETRSPTLLIKAHNNAPVVWSLKNRKCAEAAFLVKRSETIFELHIVEIKSRLTLNEFLKVIEQWKGMYLSALATLGIIQLAPSLNVFAYIAYKCDVVACIDPAQPIFMKVQVGGKQALGLAEWNTNQVTLHHGLAAKIKKGVRSPDCDFGVI